MLEQLPRRMLSARRTLAAQLGWKVLDCLVETHVRVPPIEQFDELVAESLVVVHLFTISGNPVAFRARSPVTSRAHAVPRRGDRIHPPLPVDPEAFAPHRSRLPARPGS